MRDRRLDTSIITNILHGNWELDNNSYSRFEQRHTAKNVQFTKEELTRAQLTQLTTADNS
jgi:hypothetical protein